MVYIRSFPEIVFYDDDRDKVHLNGDGGVRYVPILSHVSVGVYCARVSHCADVAPFPFVS
jgi:hypothetical protein